MPTLVASQAFDHRDSLGIIGGDPDGICCAITLGTSTPIELDEQELGVYTRMAFHLGYDFFHADGACAQAPPRRSFGRRAEAILDRRPVVHAAGGSTPTPPPRSPASRRRYVASTACARAGVGPIRLSGLRGIIHWSTLVGHSKVASLIARRRSVRRGSREPGGGAWPGETQRARAASGRFPHAGPHDQGNRLRARHLRLDGHCKACSGGREAGARFTRQRARSQRPARPQHVAEGCDWRRSPCADSAFDTAGSSLEVSPGHGARSKESVD